MQFSESFDSEKCFPIRVPEEDAFWGPKGATCLSFTRSMSSPTIKCELGFREQVLKFLRKCYVICRNN